MAVSSRSHQLLLLLPLLVAAVLFALVTDNRRNGVQIAASTIRSGRRRQLLNLGIELERTTYKLPYYIEHNLVAWDNLERSVETRDTPVFWHVLKSGGSAIKLMYATCYDLVGASETGEWIEQQQQQQQQQEQQQQLQRRHLEENENQMSPMEWIQKTMLQAWDETDETQNNDTQQLRIVMAEDGRKYVNVDVTTMEGIARASRLNFVSSGLADMIFTPLLRESAELLLDGENHKGRMFAVFRSPVHRIVSLFYYLQQATWEPTYNEQYASMTIDDYARSELCESNWMLRSLVNKMEGPLDPSDIKVAKTIIRQKCIVGLLSDMDETIVRFHSFFGFGNDEALTCARQNFAAAGGNQSNSHKHPKLDPNGETWQVIEQKNRLDIILYEYAIELWHEQGEWMRNENIL